MKKRKTIYFLILTILIWGVTIPCITLAFTCITWNVIIVKLVQLPILYFIVERLSRLYDNIKSGRISRIVVVYFTGYLILQCVFFILIYPGSWRWDDTSIYNAVAQGNFNYWHQYLTSIFYMFCMLFFPSPAAVVLGQIIVISVIVATIVYGIGKHIRSPYLRLLLFLPFILLPSISTNLWPMRLVIYSYLEIGLVVRLVLYKIEKRTWRLKDLMSLAVLAALLGVWRTEGFYYVFMIPVVFCLLFKKETSTKIKLTAVLLILITASAMYYPQFKNGSSGGNVEYEITGLCVPLIPLTHEAVVHEDEELLREINTVFDTEVIEQAYQDNVNGEYMLWNQTQYPFVREGISEEGFAFFKTVYIKLILKYPLTFIENRLQYLKRTAVGSWDPSTTTLYEQPIDYVTIFSQNYYFNQPLNIELRNMVGEFIECDGRWSKLQFFENFLPQLAVLLLLNIWLLWKHREYLLLAVTYDLRIFLTFLTAPTGWFLYYFSAYLAGILVCAVWITVRIDRIKSK